MGWQRFNRTTNVFEVSDDNGGSWQTLVIAAAGVNIPAPIPPTKPNLPASIAYEDEANIFVPPQQVNGLLTANGGIVSNSSLEIKNQPYPLITLVNNQDPVDARNFRFENWGQSFRLSAINDAQSVSQAVPLTCNRTGDVTIGRTLYTNGGIESSNYVRSTVGFYEFGRSYNLGLPIAVNIFSYVGCPHLPYSGSMCYAVVGTMMHVQIYLSGTVNAGAPNIGSYQLTLPVGATALQNGGSQLTVYDVMGWQIGSVHWTAGSGVCQLYGSNLRVWQASQLVYIMGSFWVPIN